jgi:DNA-binding transcriptional ArsR family regulator
MIDGGTFLIESPEQLRVVADPLRQRLLQAFAEPRTIRAASAALGEPLTKLYHHVDQLLAAGLVRVVREERKRAVMERYFQTVATRFAVVPSAFGSAGAGKDQRAAVARANLEELLGRAAPDTGALRIARSSARLTPEVLERLESAFGRLIEELDDPAAPEVDLMLFSARRGEVSGDGS